MHNTLKFIKYLSCHSKKTDFKNVLYEDLSVHKQRARYNV